MDELALLQKVRHPNVVQFLGAVTQSNPMMIVTEYLPKVSVDLYITTISSLLESCLTCHPENFIDSLWFQSFYVVKMLIYFG